MSKSKGFTLIELMVVIVVIGILVAISIPNMSEMRLRAREALVRENCHTVQLAAEDFSVTNLGNYPTDLSDTSPAGRTLIDLLPGAQRLQNPFTAARSEPVDGAAATPGQVGYAPILDGNGIPRGYVVTGRGHSADVATMAAGI
jgi:prepilin-type N-terminal cleavage/methylation domain-containing protein